MVNFVERAEDSADSGKGSARSTLMGFGGDRTASSGPGSVSHTTQHLEASQPSLATSASTE